MPIIKLDLIDDHALNSNVVPDDVLEKIYRNIKRTKKTPPLIVRPKDDGRYEMLDGHHRKRILRRLNIDEWECDVWKITEREGNVAIASLNTLRGQEDPRLRAQLLAELSTTIPIEQLAQFLPENQAQIEDALKLLSTDFSALEEAARAASGGGEEHPRAKTFLLYPDQEAVIQQALDTMIATEDLRRAKNPEGQALELICANYLSGASSPPVDE